MRFAVIIISPSDSTTPHVNEQLKISPPLRLLDFVKLKNLTQLAYLNLSEI